MKDLLATQYHIRPLALEKLQDNVFKATGETGDFVLKRSTLKENNLAFICAAEDALGEKGFPLTVPPVKTAAGGLYAARDGDLYTLHRFIPERRCDFDREDDLRAAAACVALLARFAALPDLAAPKGRDHTLRHREELLKRGGDLARFERIALSEPDSPRSKLYLSYAKEARRRAEESLAKLDASAYRLLAKKEAKAGTVVHFDVAARNFIIFEGSAFLIDFDYCRRDLSLVDLGRLIRRALKGGSDAVKRLDLILTSYRAVKPLSDEELEVISALLSFPQTFWRRAERCFRDDKKDKEADPRDLEKAIRRTEEEKQWLTALKQ